MTQMEKIVEQLQKKLPLFHFFIYRGFFNGYIAVEMHDKIHFTIWVDANSGQPALLDEIDLYKNNWWELKWKSRVFHWSKFGKKLPRKDYVRTMTEKMALNLPERKLARNRLEEALQNIHIS